ncbi:hypothetical protein GJR96_15505 [Haloferax sp. MBLA0076]|uniref:Tetrapyrrole biosynthesis glutamyl-tRNA reductase dimerisation domain-containing protein n=1 Tax=Haloferax litoreum TaxID=2666140 RepID=A0A6A8GM96_9EURY|nr:MULTISPECIES: hypothetical protein [Haloferax]KAB1190386.1 hypothetical protein Hfx1148_15430 [Haloferax sp. CBA1148]MRX23357.1 hypothetical protein [Haloferax litoreum]
MREPERDPEQLRRALRVYGQEVKERELEHALSRLEAGGTVSPAQQSTLEQMAATIVEEILTPSIAALDDPERDDETVRTVTRLYGLEVDSEGR